MKLKDIIELAYSRTDELIEDREPGIDIIMINAINQGAGLISTNLEKKTKTATIAYAKNLKFPSDFFSLVEIEHVSYGKLALTDYDIFGDLIIHKVASITSGSFTLTYIYTPIAIKDEETDLPYKDFYCISLAAFAAYQYMLSLKNVQVAQMFLNEFSQIIKVEKGDKQ